MSEQSNERAPMKPTEAWVLANDDGTIWISEMYYSRKRTERAAEEHPGTHPRHVLITENGGWRPIAEAKPKEREEFLVLDSRGRMVVAEWRSDWLTWNPQTGDDEPEAGWKLNPYPMGREIVDIVPTQFMPLFAPPKEAA